MSKVINKEYLENTLKDYTTQIVDNEIKNKAENAIYESDKTIKDALDELSNGVSIRIIDSNNYVPSDTDETIYFCR